MAAEFRKVFALKRRLELDLWRNTDQSLFSKYVTQDRYGTNVVLGRFKHPQPGLEGELQAWNMKPATASKPGPEMAEVLDEALRLMVRKFSKGCVALDVVDGQIVPVAVDADGEIILELADHLRRNGPGVCLFCGKSLPSGSRSTRLYCGQNCQKRDIRRRGVAASEVTQ